MARQKQATPTRRQPSSEIIHRHGANGEVSRHSLEKEQERFSNGDAHQVAKNASPTSVKKAGLTELVVCVAGIYASFLSWALLQERITTTSYGPSSKPEVFQYPVFLNTVQSSFAALAGYIYLVGTTDRASSTPAIFPSRSIFGPLLLVSVTSSLASPFGYASLKHIDYITFILAKSCKLLPVMALHLTVFRKRFPLYKYAVVALVTAGVAVFTLHHPSSKKSRGPENSSLWGLFLLGINLLFDGLTNSTQDYIFQTFQPFSGPQMMCAQNILNTVLTLAYLLVSPYIAQTGIGSFIGLELSASGEGEFGAALAFMQRHPNVARDVLAFSACGAIGQVFIFYTLSTFSSLLLVTVTVTRKMLTMMLSVVWFGHRLSSMQWVGVGLVFGGVGAEGWIQRREKKRREEEKGRLKSQ